PLAGKSTASPRCLRSAQTRSAIAERGAPRTVLPALSLDFPGWAAERGDHRREALARSARHAVLIALGTPLVHLGRVGRRAGPGRERADCRNRPAGPPADRRRSAGPRHGGARACETRALRRPCRGRPAPTPRGLALRLATLRSLDRQAHSAGRPAATRVRAW